MGSTPTNYVKLGIFVAIGFLLLAGVLYYISAKQQFFASTFRISGVFRDVSGLQAGNNVRFSGVTVGLVKGIHMESDTTVRVEMLINEDAHRFMKSDAVATIGSEGLMGNKIVVIMPGTENQPEIEDNGVIATRPPVDIDRLLLTLKTTGDNVEQITGDLSAIVRSVREGRGTIGQLVMDSTYLKEARDNITRISDDLATVSGSLRSGKGTLGKLLMDSTYLAVPIENATRLTGDLSDIVASIRSGRGAAGRLLMDSTTALTLDTTLVNLKVGSYHLKRVMEDARNSFLLWGF
ncbi:MAG: MCE family protein [Ignavibacteriae bacterium]|nr:MCE family protein [Ignavibacteriota bacterium]